MVTESPSKIGWALAFIPFTVAIVTLVLACRPTIQLLPEVKYAKWKHVYGKLESFEENTVDPEDSKVAYTYEVDGQTYKGDTIFAYSWIRDQDRQSLMKRLRAKKTGAQLEVRYDERNPARSVLNARFDFEGVMQWIGMQLSFSAMATVLAFFALYFRSTETHEKSLRLAYPQEPWNWRPEWQKGVITTSTGCGSLIAIPLGASILIFTLVPTLINALNSKQFFPDALSLLIPAFGVLFLVPGLISFMKNRKFKKMAFHLDTIPGVKGGQLKGVLVVPRPVPCEEVVFSLRCDKTTSRPSNNGPSTSTKTIWTDDATIKQGSGAIRRVTEIPVCFNIPYDAQESSPDSGYPHYDWRLRVTADVPGWDLVGEFDVPVFETPDSDPDFDPDSCSDDYVETADERSVDDLICSAAEQKIQISGGEDRLEIYMGGFQSKALSIAMPFWTLLFVLVPPAAVISFCYWMNVWFGSYRLRIEGNVIRYSHRVFGIGPTKTIPIADVLDIHATMYGNYHYKLEMAVANAKTVKMLPWIEGKRDAKAIGNLILAYCRGE